jgi:cell division transport system ATP-binding protein
LLQQKSVFENVAFALEVIGKKPDAINRVVPDVLEMVGLSGKASRLPAELSGGEQQRVAIARAMVAGPQLVLADEPTGALDSCTGRDILGLFSELNTAGCAVILVTHDIQVAGNARRILAFGDGELLGEQSPTTSPVQPAAGNQASENISGHPA